MTRKSLLFIFMVFLLSVSAIAGEISLEEAVRTGLENNHELVQKYQDLLNLERERASLEAGIGWTWSVGSNYGYVSERYTGNIYNPVAESMDSLAFTLDGGKITLKGLDINTHFSLTDYEPFSFENLDENYRFRLDVSKRLFPLLPTGAERSLLQLDGRIRLAEDDLAQARIRKEIEWVSAYLNLLRLQERIQDAQARYRLALENLASVEFQAKMGEAGKEQLLAAQLAVKEAELQEKQLLNTFLQARDSFILDTGIDGELLLTKDSDYLRGFLERADAIDIELGTEEIERLLRDNNLQLRQLKFSREYAEEELKWQEDEGKIKVDTFGNYNYDAGLPEEYRSYWELGVGVSYEFYDSGEQKLAVEGIEARIENLEREYAHTLERLKQELAAMYAQYRVDQMALEIRALGLERTRLQAALYKEQYDNGLISDNQYEELVLALRQAELDYKEALDKVRFDKLRIALFLGI